MEKIHLAANHRPSSVVLYEDQKFTQTRGPAGSRLQVAGESRKEYIQMSIIVNRMWDRMTKDHSFTLEHRLLR